MKEDNSTEQVGSLKKRELCRKKQPHNFVLALPDFLLRKNPDVTLEQVEAYYKYEEMTREFEDNARIELFNNHNIFLGIRLLIPRKHYQCSVCGKKEFNLKIHNENN